MKIKDKIIELEFDNINIGEDLLRRINNMLLFYFTIRVKDSNTDHDRWMLVIHNEDMYDMHIQSKDNGIEISLYRAEYRPDGIHTDTIDLLASFSIDRETELKCTSFPDKANLLALYSNISLEKHDFPKFVANVLEDVELDLYDYNDTKTLPEKLNKFVSPLPKDKTYVFLVDNNEYYYLGEDIHTLSNTLMSYFG